MASEAVQSASISGSSEHLSEYRDWDVNDLLRLFWSTLPRRRWITLNTEYYGPLFSASLLLDVPLRVLELLLEPADWLHWMETRKKSYVWLYRPLGNNAPIRDKALLESTTKGGVSSLK